MQVLLPFADLIPDWETCVLHVPEASLPSLVTQLRAVPPAQVEARSQVRKRTFGKLEAVMGQAVFN